ncbi:MAG TPA: efflux RND transporter periplasmic adaptor subunit [Candidatus Binatia bacterium]|nr:efflux RND transporter periplasmic adaptor subunit [Candidatus Binatia bacterium]
MAHEHAEQDARAQATASEPPPSATFLSRPVIVTAVATAVIVSAGLTVFRSKATGVSDPTHMAATLESTQTTPAAASSAGENRVQPDIQHGQHFQLVPAEPRTFRAEKVAPGKIAFNEAAITPVFSFSAGRIVRLLAKPGDLVEPGSPLFEIDTPDLMQAESDVLTARTSLAKAHNLLNLAQRTENRIHDLYDHKAVAFKEWEQAQSDRKNAESDVHAAEAVLAAARGRLRVLGKSEAEIDRLEEGRGIDRVARVVSPIAGTITARKVSPGQYVRTDNTDPLFVIADLSTMWMLANVYETDVPLLRVGQPVEVRLLAYPDEIFQARIDYIGAMVDPTTHRLEVRCVVENRDEKLKPEMIATFRIETNAAVQSLAVPLTTLVHDGEKTTVWVAQLEEGFVERQVTAGIEQDGYAQVLSGLLPGELVVTDGSLFLSNAGRS